MKWIILIMISIFVIDKVIMFNAADDVKDECIENNFKLRYEYNDIVSMCSCRMEIFKEASAIRLALSKSYAESLNFRMQNQCKILK